MFPEHIQGGNRDVQDNLSDHNDQGDRDEQGGQIMVNRVIMILGASTLILNEANVPHYFLFNRSQRGRYKISGYMYPH